MSMKRKDYDFEALAHKYTLSFQEAMEYFRIGEKRLTRLIKENEDADWVLYVGNRHYIKRPLFEAYLAGVNRL